MGGIRKMKLNPKADLAHAIQRDERLATGLTGPPADMEEDARHKGHGRKLRICLAPDCGVEFASSGSGNRRCPNHGAISDGALNF